MKLQTSVLDKALEWLIPKIGDPDIPKVLVMNYDSTDEVDALQAYCVWCLRLRYNLVEYQKNGIDVNDYGTWRPETRWQSKNLYALAEKVAKLYTLSGGRVPSYDNRHHADVSKWTYKRVFGPDNFTPIHFSYSELWNAMQTVFPAETKDIAESNRKQFNQELELEMNIEKLMSVLKECVVIS